MEETTIKVNKSDLILILKSYNPSFDEMDNVPIIKRNGYYSGGFSESWHWNISAFESESFKDLEEMYKTYIKGEK